MESLVYGSSILRSKEKMQVKIPAVYMRGGTSKAVFFLDDHLPKDPEIRDRVILATFGSPDPNKRQIDGMGGAVSTTSKVCILSPSKDPEYDVDYTFGQVSIDRPFVDYQGNCGNMSSAVGPYAIDEGLVRPREPVTTVRIFQVNTRKKIVAEVPVRNGLYNEEGDFSIDGVPGTGGRITLHFLRPEASVTHALLPTGNTTDQVDIPGVGTITVSIVDAGNPVVFVKAKDIGLTGTEINEIDSSEEIRWKLEAIRSRAAVMIGLASSPEDASKRSQAVPKMAFVSEQQDYQTAGGRLIRKDQIDLVCRIMSMGTLHKAYAVTGAICTAGAAKIEGTVVNEMMAKITVRERVLLGHAGGIISVGALVKKERNSYEYEEAIVDRTARRLMEGYVCVPEKIFAKG
jgi:2-methylaconitate cis-trans-isomerase PrpF